MKKYIAIAALAFALVMGMAIAPAQAYFTDQHTANGGLPVMAGPDTDIYEWVKDTTKHVVVTNSEKSVPVFVRVKADYPSPVTMKVSGDNWKADKDGWYVYQGAVDPGKETSEIVLDFDFGKIVTPDQTTPTDEDAGIPDRRIVVAYEAVPAKYHEDGTPDYGGWKHILKKGEN